MLAVKHHQGSRIMSEPIINTCGTLSAICTLIAWAWNNLPIIAAAFSVLWLSLQIAWFLRQRYKDWKKGKL